MSQAKNPKGVRLSTEEIWVVVMLAEIRQYKPKDAEAVLLLAEKYAAWDSTPTLSDIEGFHTQNPELFFVAESGSRIVGFVYGSESKPPQETLLKWKARKVGSVETLAVAQDQRRRGIATSLLERLFQTFKEKGVDTVTLSVPAEEVGAKKLYDKLGFETRAFFIRKKI